jgi:uncharacterized protein (UPF0262 family)
MSPSSLKSVHLEETGGASFLRCEKDLALKTLAEDSVFAPVNQNIPGPYELTLRIHDGRLVMDIKGDDNTPLPTLVLSIKPYSRLVRDYFMMIESYEIMRKQGTACQLEAVDMGRRGLHNEGAELLVERLKDKVMIDLETARRLFTLICILHAQNSPVF